MMLVFPPGICKLFSSCSKPIINLQSHKLLELRSFHIADQGRIQGGKGGKGAIPFLKMLKSPFGLYCMIDSLIVKVL